MLDINKIIDYLNIYKVNYKYRGSENLIIKGYCPLNALRSNCITWIRDINNYDLTVFKEYENMLIICNDTNNRNIINANFIITDNPHSVFFSILSKFFSFSPESSTIIQNSSVVETNKIGNNVQIGHCCYIGKDVEIGDSVVINNNVSIKGKVKIGKNTVIYSGVVIGMDGYGYYDDISNNHKRVPHLGGVIIGSNVEIGANTCIARGCLGDTIINDDVKIDNLCHIAHNVVIGKRSKVIALSMLAGSSVIGEDVWVAPCSAVKNQVSIGNNSLIGMGAVVTKDVEKGVVVAGVPARSIKVK